MIMSRRGRYIIEASMSLLAFFLLDSIITFKATIKKATPSKAAPTAYTIPPTLRIYNPRLVMSRATVKNKIT